MTEPKPWEIYVMNGFEKVLSNFCKMCGFIKIEKLRLPFTPQAISMTIVGILVNIHRFELTAKLKV